jgi:hypothetical protein
MPKFDKYTNKYQIEDPYYRLFISKDKKFISPYFNCIDYKESKIEINKDAYDSILDSFNLFMKNNFQIVELDKQSRRKK